MTTNIFDIRQPGIPFPESLYIDANILNEILESRTYANDVRQFMSNAVGNGTILIYSPVVLAEFKRRVHQYTYEQYASALQIQRQGRKQPWKVLEDQRNPAVGQASVAAWQQAKSLIVNSDSIEAYMPTLEVLEQTSNQIISKYGMGVGDAEHLAVMNHNEVNSVLTLDGGFVGADNINIFSASNTVLSHGVASSNTLISYTPFTP